MIVVEEGQVTQGDAEWHALKRGVVSASGIKGIITPTGKASKSDYLYRLVAERLTDDESTFSGNAATERGHRLEDEALDDFVASLRMVGHDVEVSRPAFVFGDSSHMYGCSPDAFIRVGSDLYGYEGKAPAGVAHLQYMESGVIPPEYIGQVRYSLWCCNRQAPDVAGWFFNSYHPQLDPFSVKVMRSDDAQIAWAGLFEPIFDDFMRRYESMLAQSRAV